MVCVITPEKAIFPTTVSPVQSLKKLNVSVPEKRTTRGGEFGPCACATRLAASISRQMPRILIGCFIGSLLSWNCLSDNPIVKPRADLDVKTHGSPRHDSGTQQLIPWRGSSQAGNVIPLGQPSTPSSQPLHWCARGPSGDTRSLGYYRCVVSICGSGGACVALASGSVVTRDEQEIVPASIEIIATGR